jgi:predicted XRE-type DNA-binding protein
MNRRVSMNAKVVNRVADGATEKKTKLDLAVEINRIIGGRKMTQDEAARSLQITQPKVSALANYRLAGFSVERLMQFLNSLGCGVEIVLHRPKTRGGAETVVTANYGEHQ